MRVDLHVHSSERSRCAVNTAEEMIRSAIEFGLDALVFADHATLLPADLAAEWSAKYAPFRVFRGIECSVAEGEDIVVLGAFDPRLEQREIPYADVHAIAREQGGFLILAHPFRYGDAVGIDLAAAPPDAVELHSICISGRDEPRIRELAARAGARLVQNSDGHRAETVGIFHNRLPRPAADEKELVSILRAGEYELCRSEDRIARRNEQVREAEAEMRDYLARGLDGRTYCRQTGGSMDHFAKVSRGGTYLL